MKTDEYQELKSLQKPIESNRGIGKSALWVGLGTFLSRILGFIRDMTMAAYFSRTVTDAWIAAFRLPNLFRRILGEGALSVSFIPVFVELIRPGSQVSSEVDPAKRLVSAVFTLLLAVTLVLTVLGIIFAEPIINLMVGGQGFTSIPGKMEMTIHFARIMFIYVLLVCLYAYFMAVLNSLKKFWLPAFAPALWNISMIGAGLIPIAGWRESGEVLAWAVVLGGVLQLGVLIPALIKEGYFPKIVFDFSSPHLKQVFKGFGPSMIGLSIMQVTIIVNTYLASHLPEGANSWIFWADRLLELPLSLFAVSLGTALLPTLAGLWAMGKKEEFSKTASYYLRAVLFLAIPAAVGTFVLAHPIVELLFERGRFTANDTAMTAMVLKVYSLSIITASGVRVLAPCFYAVKNTVYPMFCSLVALVAHILIASWAVKEYGLQGLVGSTAISAALNLMLLLLGYSRLIGPFEYRQLLTGVSRFAFLGILMVIVLLEYPILRDSMGDHFFARLASLFIMIGSGAAVYLGTAAILKFQEVAPVMKKLNQWTKRGR